MYIDVYSIFIENLNVCLPVFTQIFRPKFFLSDQNILCIRGLNKPISNSKCNFFKTFKNLKNSSKLLLEVI